ncbi:MAG: aldo/keto reductase [Spirochaetota bacterium]
MNQELNTGYSIPAVGLGTWRAKGDEVYNAVKKALDVGYRHIDSAVAYRNEEQVGKGIADSSVERSEIFLTTKIWNVAHDHKAAAEQIDQSLKNFQTDYIDLVLIHWPFTYERNAAVWRAMEEAVASGKIRSIGVSNFHIHHINALLENAEILPAVNQVECHVGLQNTRLKEYLDAKGMILEAYAPFKSDKVHEVLENETLQAIGSTHGKTPTQVTVRWLMQRGIVALPKSVTPSRIDENFQVFDFELSADEMHKIRKLNGAQKLFPEPDNVDFGFVSL